MDQYTQRTTIMKCDKRTVRIMTSVGRMPSAWGLCVSSEAWVTSLAVSAGDNSLSITRFSLTQEEADKKHTDFVHMAFLMGFELSSGHTSYRRADKKNPERR